MYIYIHLYANMCTYINTFMHVHCNIYTHMCTCIHIYAFICIYTHNHFLSHNNRLFMPSILFILHYKNCEPGHHLFAISNFLKHNLYFVNLHCAFSKYPSSNQNNYISYTKIKLMIVILI